MITKFKEKGVEEYCLLNSSFGGHSSKCKFRINSLIYKNYKNYKHKQNAYDGHFSLIDQLFNYEMDINDERRDINDKNNLLTEKTLENPYGEGYLGQAYSSSTSSSSCSSDDEDEYDDEDESDYDQSDSSSFDPWRQRLREQFLKSSGSSSSNETSSRVIPNKIVKCSNVANEMFLSKLLKKSYCMYCGGELILNGSSGKNICNDCKDNWIGNILVDTSHASGKLCLKLFPNVKLGVIGINPIPHMVLAVVKGSKCISSNNQSSQVQNIHTNINVS